MARTILTDKEWEIIKAFIPDNKGKKGHPARDYPQILEAILWVLRTGAPWRMANYLASFKKTLMTKHTFWTPQLSKSTKMHGVQLEKTLVHKPLKKQLEVGVHEYTL